MRICWVVVVCLVFQPDTVIGGLLGSTKRSTAEHNIKILRQRTVLFSGSLYNVKREYVYGSLHTSFYCGRRFKRATAVFRAQRELANVDIEGLWQAEGSWACVETRFLGNRYFFLRIPAISRSRESGRLHSCSWPDPVEKPTLWHEGAGGSLVALPFGKRNL